MSHNIIEITTELYRWFDEMNAHFFENRLEEPIITIQKTKSNTRGWFTTDPVWVLNGSDKDDSNKDCKYEICISAFNLEISKEFPIYELVGILLHEMVHYNNRTVKMIKDCSGRVHNKKFAETARAVGLEVEKNKSVGYGITAPSESLIQYIENELKPNINAFKYYREIPVPKPKKEKEKEPKYSYTCPECNKTFVLKNKYNLKCGDCDANFVVEEDVE